MTDKEWDRMVVLKQRWDVLDGVLREFVESYADRNDGTSRAAEEHTVERLGLQRARDMVQDEINALRERLVKKSAEDASD